MLLRYREVYIYSVYRFSRLLHTVPAGNGDMFSETYTRQMCVTEA